MLELRPYQVDAVDRVRDAYRAGRRRVLVSLPTGTGKTVVFASFPRVLRMRRRLLVLAHREELLVQARDKFRLIDPELRVEIERGGERASADAAVVVASVPTLARAGGARLARLPVASALAGGRSLKVGSAVTVSAPPTPSTRQIRPPSARKKLPEGRSYRARPRLPRAQTGARFPGVAARRRVS